MGNSKDENQPPLKQNQAKKYTGKALLKALESASGELIYISETDSPFLTFAGRKVNEVSSAEIVSQTNDLKGCEIEQRSFDEFFDRLTNTRDWFGPEEIKRARRFENLRAIMENNLTDLKVYRFGRIRIRIYVVGLDADNNLLGIKTEAVET